VARSAVGAGTRNDTILKSSGPRRGWNVGTGWSACVNIEAGRRRERAEPRQAEGCPVCDGKVTCSGGTTRE